MISSQLYNWSSITYNQVLWEDRVRGKLTPCYVKRPNNNDRISAHVGNTFLPRHVDVSISAFHLDLLFPMCWSISTMEFYIVEEVVAVLSSLSVKFYVSSRSCLLISTYLLFSPLIFNYTCSFWWLELKLQYELPLKNTVEPHFW